MRTAIFPPKPPRLREYVQYFWTLSAKQDDAPCSIIGPEAYFDVILSFAAATVWKNQQQQRFALRGSFLSGMRTEPFEVEAQGDVEYLAIRFYPHRFASLAGAPLAEITSLHAVELDALNYIQQPASVDWGEVVYQLGYCDQSHFIKECVEFLGRSPEQCRQLALNTQ